MAQTQPNLIQAWEAEPLFRRLQACRSMLAVHGYLTDRQNVTMRRKIDREEERRKAIATIAERAAGGPAGEG
jgi:hypothetical protein